MTVIPASAEKWVLTSAIIASSMAFIDGSALTTALPIIQTDLAADATQLLWISNAYLLFLASLILVGGALGDHYGRKRMFGIGIASFTATSLLCGLAPTAELLIVARALQGVAGALMVPGSLAIISASFSPQRRGTAIGTWSTFSTLTTVGAPTLGGWLAAQGLWRAIFFINVPLGIIAFIVLILRVPESHNEKASRKIDFLGALLTMLGLAGLTYGFTRAPELGFSDVTVLGALIGGVLSLVAFVFVEARSDHPMVPLSLFKSRSFSGTNLLTLFLYAALAGYQIFLSLNLQQVQGYRPEIAGLAFMPFSIILGAMGRWSGGLVDRVGARLPLIIGPSLVGVGFALSALPGLTAGESDYWLTYFPTFLFMAIGMGVTVAPLTTTVFASAPQESAGIASGFNNAVARTASVLAIAILGSLALFTFGGSLQTRTADFSLTDSARVELNEEARKLADAAVPAGLDAATTENVTLAIKWSFIDTFRLVALICAGLSFLSAGMAALLVDGKKVTAASTT